MNKIKIAVFLPATGDHKVLVEVLDPYTHPMMIPVTKTGSRTFERREPEREMKTGFQRASSVEDVLPEDYLL